MTDSPPSLTKRCQTRLAAQRLLVPWPRDLPPLQSLQRTSQTVSRTAPASSDHQPFGPLEPKRTKSIPGIHNNDLELCAYGLKVSSKVPSSVPEPQDQGASRDQDTKLGAIATDLDLTSGSRYRARCLVASSVP